MNRIVVLVDGVEQPGIPTPRLIEAGGGQAYFVPNTKPETTYHIPGVWYLKDKGYESPDGTYQTVRVVSVSEGDPFDE